MWPDRQIISLYLDGELPSPWKEKMETHLESCPECRAALAVYKCVGKALREDPGTLQAASDRVWRKLTAPELVISGKDLSFNSGNSKSKVQQAGAEKKVWNRTITLPLPAAAAAAAIIIAAFFTLVGIRGQPRYLPQETVAAAGIELDDRGIVPIQDMSGILQYLSSQDSGDFMVIRLPESRTFSRNGEPALLNAADYSRRHTFR